MKKLIALLMVACFAGSVIGQNAPQQKTSPNNNLASKDKGKEHHRHHHRRGEKR